MGRLHRHLEEFNHIAGLVGCAVRLATASFETITTFSHHTKRAVAHFCHIRVVIYLQHMLG